MVDGFDYLLLAMQILVHLGQLQEIEFLQKIILHILNLLHVSLNLVIGVM
jgi:hypothetical protein